MNNYLIKIEDIENAPKKTLAVDFDDFIEGVKSDEPIKASLELKSLGEFIEVSGRVEGNAILECDLCLGEFAHKLDFEVCEMFAKHALQEDYSQETELKEGQFVFDLMGAKEIDILDLLYQSVILDFPNKKVCGINCKGNNFENDETYSQNQTDPRLEVFKNINIQTRKADN